MYNQNQHVSVWYRWMYKLTITLLHIKCLWSVSKGHVCDQTSWCLCRPHLFITLNVIPLTLYTTTWHNFFADFLWYSGQKYLMFYTQNVSFWFISVVYIYILTFSYCKSLILIALDYNVEIFLYDRPQE